MSFDSSLLCVSPLEYLRNYIDGLEESSGRDNSYTNNTTNTNSYANSNTSGNTMNSNITNTNNGYELANTITHHLTTLLTVDVITSLPSLNTRSYASLTPYQLVKYRCIIKDIKNIEYYKLYTLEKDGDNNIRKFMNIYKENHVQTENTVIIDSDDHSNLAERTVYHCGNIPGDALWTGIENKKTTSKVSKRKYNDEYEFDLEMEVEANNNTSKANKVVDTPIEESVDYEMSNDVYVSFYHDYQGKITDSIEVIGILLPSDDNIPRISCLTVRDVNEYEYKQNLTSDELINARLSLLQYLSSHVGPIVAEYLIVFLHAKIYSRVSETIISLFSMNILSQHREFYEFLTTFLSSISPRFCQLPFSTTSLSKLQLLSKRIIKNTEYMDDMEEEVMEAGRLLLAKNTVLLIDELDMKEGQIDEIGVSNLQHLYKLLKEQTVPVQYNDYVPPVQIPTDIRCLVVSNGKSILPPECRVKLISFNAVSEVPTNFELWRRYLFTTRQISVKIDDTVGAHVQNDFLNDASMKRSTDLLHYFLTTSKCFAASFGEDNLTVDRWIYMRNMEQLRSQTMSTLA